ncbi:TetR/AcrR family transcriptional regulator [Streptomyces pluripotens]|uniref:TetR/AcrR family transcriptional regulator n=1 Tax=Streptomyces pluripotens TaxID=1355015 RepID=A0A221P774_9ACTN|nr:MULTISPECIES: TetR/AcrR family transcriptional regulator [Streptomyces]ARP73746.1 TetR family transcriptional regulator [Streptomyces pluripotens]ASN27992.1 TetR/AcrR family transcriptional regulator [Streptomyces pluripotens]MCH0559317.1 TetR/AcrR family transcriptional regulator [Streptomyces sp. MUM 16J]
MPRQVDREARRGEILAAAVRVFARHGYADSRIEDIAREAGMAKGSVYLYFSSREDLLRAAFDGMSTRSEELIAEVGRHPGDTSERLAFLVRSVLALLTRERDLARVLLDVWSAGARKPAWVDMAAFYQDYRAAVAALLDARDEDGTEPSVAPYEHATVLVGAIEGCVLQWLFDPSVDLATLAEPIVTLLVPRTR